MLTINKMGKLRSKIIVGVVAAFALGFILGSVLYA